MTGATKLAQQPPSSSCAAGVQPQAPGAVRCSTAKLQGRTLSTAHPSSSIQAQSAAAGGAEAVDSLRTALRSTLPEASALPRVRARRAHQ